MQVTPKKTFVIDYRAAGRNSYFTAKCGREVYTSKSLSYLKDKVRSKGHDFTVNFWQSSLKLLDVDSQLAGFESQTLIKPNAH